MRFFVACDTLSAVIMIINTNLTEAEQTLFNVFQTLFKERNIDSDIGQDIIKCIQKDRKARIKMVGVLGDLDIEVATAQIPSGHLFSDIRAACMEKSMSMAQTARVISLLCTNRQAQIRAISVIQDIVAPDEGSAYTDVFGAGQPFH